MKLSNTQIDALNTASKTGIFEWDQKKYNGFIFNRIVSGLISRNLIDDNLRMTEAGYKAIGQTAPTETTTTPPKRQSKIAIVIELMSQEDGVSLNKLCNETGWAKHTVRGAIAGNIKKRGYKVESFTHIGYRYYRIVS